jgi:Carboxypeptidase regulatory-like domain/TonB-dependent Receptor Plug Domain/Gram-negative bacterial TonB protein C-terminal
MCKLVGMPGLSPSFALVAFLTSASVLSAPPLAAQREGVITGTVTDSSGVSVLGAEIAVEGTAGRAVSGERGVFRISGVPLGAHTLSARRLGFAPFQVGVQVSDVSEAIVAIRLKLLAAALPPVVIRASRMSYTGRLAGYYERLEKQTSGYFITREQIDRENPDRLGQLLQRVPGISAVRGPAGITGVRMRGRRCWPLVWIDGTPMPAGEVDLDSFAPSTIQGIELYLGSTTAPLRYIYNRDLSSCGTVLIWSRGPDTDPVTSSPAPSVDLKQLLAHLAVYNADQVDRRARLDTATVLRLTFPPPLFAARVAGLVVAEFVVDSVGRVEAGTVGIISSTAPLFTDAVRVALETANYVPAIKEGRPVRQLVQQRFQFDFDRQANPQAGPDTVRNDVICGHIQY